MHSRGCGTRGGGLRGFFDVLGFLVSVGYLVRSQGFMPAVASREGGWSEDGGAYRRVNK